LKKQWYSRSHPRFYKGKVLLFQGLVRRIAAFSILAITDLAIELNVELLVIGATGHSAIYERMIGSRTDRITQLAKCPVLVVK
jgi:nucleotide-binding universal stress UspA family protein